MFTFDKIFSQSTDAVFAIDNACRIIYQNEKFARSFTHSSSERKNGAKCYDVVCGKTLEGEPFCRPNCVVGRALVNGERVENFDLTIPGARGRTCFVSVGAFPISQTKTPVAAVCVIRFLNLFHLFKVLSRTEGNGWKKETGCIGVTTVLSNREHEILELIAHGNTTQDMAKSLGISVITVRKHIQNIFKKLHVHSRADVVSYAYRNNLI